MSIKAGGSDIAEAIGKIKAGGSDVTKVIAGGETVWQSASWSPDEIANKIGWYEIGPGVCFQDRAGTVPCTAAGQPVRRIATLSGGADLIPPDDSDTASRPVRLRKDSAGWYIDADSFAAGGSSSSVLDFVTAGFGNRTSLNARSVYVFGEQALSGATPFGVTQTLFTSRALDGRSACTVDGQVTATVKENGRLSNVAPSGWGAGSTAFGSAGNPVSALTTNRITGGSSIPGFWNFQFQHYVNGVQIKSSSLTNQYVSTVTASNQENGFSRAVMTRFRIRMMLATAPPSGDYTPSAGNINSVEYAELDNYCNTVLPTKYG